MKVGELKKLRRAADVALLAATKSYDMAEGTIMEFQAAAAFQKAYDFKKALIAQFHELFPNECDCAECIIKKNKINHHLTTHNNGN